jgi:hypothetical protein
LVDAPVGGDDLLAAVAVHDEDDIGLWLGALAAVVVDDENLMVVVVELRGDPEDEEAIVTTKSFGLDPPVEEGSDNNPDDH